MKYDIQKAFPYPVLSDDKDYNDDYPTRDFQAMVNLEEGKDGCVVLTAHFEVSEEAILECIEKKDAVYGVHVLCSKTNYRRLIRSSKQDLTHRFKSGELYDKVVLMGCVVCNSPVSSYKSENFHEELSGRKYNLAQGSVLAISQPEPFVVDADLNRPLVSVFESNSDYSIKTGEFNYNVEGHTIVINMNPSNYERFSTGEKDSTIRNFLLMSVCYPVLVEVLRIMASEEAGNYEDKKWYRAIHLRLEKLEIDISSVKEDDIYIHAQKLMEYPLTKLPLGEVE